MLKRREFLIGSGVALVVTRLGPLALPSAAQETVRGKDRFLALLNSWFEVSGQGLGLELVDVVDRPAPGLEQFSLRFRGAPQPALAAGTYDLYHGALGSLALYLEPASVEGGSAWYRADFSLLREPA